VSLTDLMSNADLTVWPKAAMVIFLGVFVLVTVRALREGTREQRHRFASIPLEDEPGRARHASHADDRQENR
jgi:cbb3-type cytochrome oxidase subunit 3